MTAAVLADGVLERVQGRAAALERIGASEDSADLRAILSALSPEAPAREDRLREALIRMIEHFERVDAPEADRAVIQYANKAWAGVEDAPRHEAPARNPLDPDAPSEAMIDAGLKVDWSDEDERGTVVNVWYAMNAARRHKDPAEGAGERSGGQVAFDAWNGRDNDPYWLLESDAWRQRWDRVADALSAAQAVAWRPIESAPKDGTAIDVWRDEGGRETVYWGYPPHECGEMGGLCDSDWHSIRAAGWVCNTFGEFLGRNHNPFTHWQPLPSGPASTLDVTKGTAK